MPTPAPIFPEIEWELQRELLHADEYLGRRLGAADRVTIPAHRFSLNTEFARADKYLEQAGLREPPPPPSMVFGEFTSGLGAGLDHIGTNLLALRATGAQLLNDQDTYNELIPRIRESQQETAEQYPKTVERVEDIGSVSDAVRFFSRTLGEQVPVIASIFAGGGAGALVGRAIARGLISRQVGLALAAKLPSYSAGAAAVGTAAGLETGATAEEQLGAIDKIRPGVAITAGLVKGSLEALVPAALGARLGLTPDLSRGVIGKIIDVFNRVMPRRLAAAPAIGLTEGLTESMQEVVDLAAREYIDENYDAMGEDGASRLLNAAVTGALLGTVMGPLFGGAGSGGSIRETQEELPGAGAGSPSPDPVADAEQAAGLQDTGIDALSQQMKELPPPAGTDSIGLLPSPTGPAGLLPPPGAAQFRDPSAITLDDRSFVGPDVLPVQDLTGNIYLPDGRITDVTDPGELSLDIVATGDNVPAGQKWQLPEDDTNASPSPAPSDGVERPGAADGRDLPADANEAPPSGKTGLAAKEDTRPAPSAPNPNEAPAIPHKWHSNATELLELRMSDVAEREQLQQAQIADENWRATDEQRQAYNNFTTSQLNDRYSSVMDVATGNARLVPDYNSITPDTVETYILQTKEQMKEYSSTDLAKVRKFQTDTNNFLRAAKKELGITDPIFVRVVMEKDKISSAGNSKETTFIDKEGKIRPLREIRTVFYPKNPEMHFSTVVHELGHVVHETAYNKLPHGIKTAVLQAYNRENAYREENADYYLTNMISPFQARSFMMDDKVESTGIDMNHAAYREAIHKDLERDSAYWHGFEEWMAEQLVRAQSVTRSRLDAVEQFFKQLTGLLRKVIRIAFGRKYSLKATRDARGRYKSAMDPFAATKEYEAMLAYLKERAIHEPGTFRNLYETSQAASAEQNSKTLHRMGIVDEQHQEQAPPQSPQSVETDELLKNAGVKKQQREEITAPADRFNWFMKVFLTIQQIAKENPGIRQLQEYIELLNSWYSSQMQWVSMADDTARAWMSLGRKQGKALSEFIIAVERGDYMKTLELTGPRQPTEQELAELAQKYQLTEPALELYHRIQEDFKKALDHMERTAVTDAQRVLRNPVKLQERLEKIQKEFADMRRKPYFPHARFGNYAVAVIDKITGTRLSVEHVESHRQAKKLQQQLMKQHPDAVVKLHAVPKIAHQFQGLPTVMLEQIRERLGQQMSTEQLEWLDQYINELAISTGMQKRMAKSRGIAGYSTDALRTYSQYFMTNSRMFAKMAYGGRLEATIADLRRTSRDDFDTLDTSKRDKIAEYMENHYEYIMNPRQEWAGLRAFAFQFWLGFHVKSAVLNFTQLPMVAVPQLSALYGDAAALNAVRKGITSIGKLYNAKQSDVPDNLLQAIDIARREGVIDESQATELAGIAQGQYLNRFLPGDKNIQFLMNMNYYGAWMFQFTEKINRRVVFRAAWDLALQEAGKSREYLNTLEQNNPETMQYLTVDMKMPRNEARAYLAARQAVWDTQYQYAAHSRPAFMRGKKGTLFTFFMFMQQSMYFAFRQPGRARFWLMMLAAGGLMGLPGAEDLTSIAKFIGRRVFGEHYDPERDARELIVELADGTIPPDLILNGTSRYGFGLPAVADAIGVPAPYVDLSASMSFGKLVPGLTDALSVQGKSHEAQVSNMLSGIAGAAFGPGLNLFHALNDSRLPVDDFKRWERALPRSLANLAKATRYVTEGRERTRTGATVAEFDMSDPFSLAEIAATATGFSSTRIAQRWDREMMTREAESYWATQRNMLLNRLDHGYMMQDGEEVNNVLQDIRKYNQNTPYNALSITGKDISRSRKSRIRARLRFQAGLGTSRAYTPLAQQTAGLFPEVRDEELYVENVPAR